MEISITDQFYRRIEVKLVFDPKWDHWMMSEEGKRQLGI